MRIIQVVTMFQIKEISDLFEKSHFSFLSDRRLLSRDCIIHCSVETKGEIPCFFVAFSEIYNIIIQIIIFIKIFTINYHLISTKISISIKRVRNFHKKKSCFKKEFSLLHNRKGKFQIKKNLNRKYFYFLSSLVLRRMYDVIHYGFIRKLVNSLHNNDATPSFRKAHQSSLSFSKEFKGSLQSSI